MWAHSKSASLPGFQFQTPNFYTSALSLSLSPLCSFVHPSFFPQSPAMGKKASADWMGPTAKRLDATRQTYTDADLPSDDALVAAYTAPPAQLHSELSSQPSQAGALQAGRTHREASLLMHRRGESVQPSSFNPARHTVMILGRPVQVAFGRLGSSTSPSAFFLG